MTEANTHKPPIYLLDSMAFIFRAYHAMQRSRPMSTRTGIPTAATYVFVNMINKLRKDFQPEYLAAVYDVGAPVHRNEIAAQMKDVKKFNIKTQQFETIEYGGYKANRAETPPDLIQQQPYIRRALEAFRIPILYYEGFEADDVIGTLSCKLAALGHHVYVVSSDKDMMQLVNKDVSILNPTKDNLILDPAGVEEILGVPPERVIDVMALRGDSIDNIPGAPGIGDKGSVELIQQFGTVEAALDRADEVKKKTYRESLQNNRDNILLSKELVTIHTSVPIEYSLEAMRTQPVDNAACRELFSELEFTTLLKELAPSVDNTAITFNLKPTAKEIAALLTEARAINPTTSKPNGLAIAIFEDARAIAEEIAAEPDPESPPSPNHPPPKTCPSSPRQRRPQPPHRSLQHHTPDPACRLGLAVNEHLRHRSLPRRPQPSKPPSPTPPSPRTSTTSKPSSAPSPRTTSSSPESATTSCSSATSSTPPTPPTPCPTSPPAPPAARSSTNPPKTTPPTPTASPKPPPPSSASPPPSARRSPKPAPSSTTSPTTTPPSAEPSPPRCSSQHPQQSTASPSSDTSPLQNVYNTIDLPLVPVLLRMEQTGVRIDPDILRTMSDRLAIEIDNLAEHIYTDSGHRFNINSPKQLGDVLFNKMLLPKPMKYGKGKVVSTAQDVLEELAETPPHRRPRHRAPPAPEAQGHLPRRAPAARRLRRPHPHHLQPGRHRHRPPLLHQPQPAEHPHPHRHRPRDPRRLHRRPRQPPHVRRLLADRAPPHGALLAGPTPAQRLPHRPGHPHPHRRRGLRRRPRHHVQRDPRPRQGRQLRHRLRHQPLRSRRPAQHPAERSEALHRNLLRPLQRRPSLHRRRPSKPSAATGAVRTYFGRIRPIPDIQSRNPNMRGFAERTAVNTPLQGTAADLIKLAMIRIDAAITTRKLRSRMTLQVHDELLFDVIPTEAEELQQLVKHEMENVAEFSIPIVADVGLGQITGATSSEERRNLRNLSVRSCLCDVELAVSIIYVNLGALAYRDLLCQPIWDKNDQIIPIDLRDMLAHQPQLFPTRVKRNAEHQSRPFSFDRSA